MTDHIRDAAAETLRWHQPIPRPGMVAKCSCGWIGAHENFTGHQADAVVAAVTPLIRAERGREIAGDDYLAGQWIHTLLVHYGSSAALSDLRADLHRRVALTGEGDRHPCGHDERTRGCGGCDPGAIEYVKDDGDPFWHKVASTGEGDQ